MHAPAKLYNSNKKIHKNLHVQYFSAQRTRGDCRWDRNGDAIGVRFIGDC